jgi:hypothetical protein
MKTLFNALEKKNPYLSSLVIMNTMITDGLLETKAEINKCFKLVDKGDYMRKDKDAILQHSYSLLKSV